MQSSNQASSKSDTQTRALKCPFLIAGTPDELHQKVPQAVNLNTWSATFFVGKDGRVRKVHSGFAAPASGKFNSEFRAEFTLEIYDLLGGESVSSAIAPKQPTGAGVNK